MVRWLDVFYQHGGFCQNVYNHSQGQTVYPEHEQYDLFVTK
jgi:hypothetical protein